MVLTHGIACFCSSPLYFLYFGFQLAKAKSHKAIRPMATRPLFAITRWGQRSDKITCDDVLLSQQCKSHTFFRRESQSPLLANGEDSEAQTAMRRQTHYYNQESVVRCSALLFVYPRVVLLLYNGILQQLGSLEDEANNIG